MSFFHQDTVIKEFEELTKDVMKVQIETLQMILEENGEAEYLQNLGLGGRTNPASFKACVPLVHHHDIEGHIRRIADGESSSILTGKPITSMSLSSSTTQGKPKRVPFNEVGADTREDTSPPPTRINRRSARQRQPMKDPAYIYT